VPTPPAVTEVSDALARHGYLPDEGLATAVYLAMKLRRPLLLEGEAGVGKTEVAKVLARWTGGDLIRVQCYEGIDVTQAVYEWDYARQLLHLRAAEATGEASAAGADALEHELYNERFLVKRALLQAIAPREGPSPILLIDVPPAENVKIVQDRISLTGHGENEKELSRRSAGPAHFPFAYGVSSVASLKSAKLCHIGD